MTKDEMLEQIDAWHALTDAATEPTWVRGDRYRSAHVMKDGTCAYCVSDGEPTWAGNAFLNNKWEPTHVHMPDEPCVQSNVYTHRDGAIVRVVESSCFLDQEKEAANEEFIAASRQAMPVLLDIVKRVLIEWEEDGLPGDVHDDFVAGSADAIRMLAEHAGRAFETMGAPAHARSTRTC